MVGHFATCNYVWCVEVNTFLGKPLYAQSPIFPQVIYRTLLWRVCIHVCEY